MGKEEGRIQKEETIGSNLPAGWQMAAIGDICSKPQYGYTTKAAKEGDLHLLRTTDIASGIVDWDTVPYCSVNPEDKEKYRLEDGDIVISRAGSVGVSYLVRKPEGSVFASYLIRFIAYSDKRYLKYFLEGPLYWEKISENRMGIAVPNVNANKLKSIFIPIPPEKEQHRIVAKIEELFSELDKGIESLKTAREQLKVYRQAVLKHAFEGKLTAQWPKSPWLRTTLGEKLSFLTSGSRGWARYYAEQGDIFIRAQNLKHDFLDLQDVAFVKLPGKSEGMRTRVQAGDLLITLTGANVTKTAFVKSDIGTAFVSQHVALVRPSEDCYTDFLYWYLVAEAEGRKQLNKMAYGAGKPGLNLDNIRSVEISLPCITEQKEIVSIINAMLTIQENLTSDIEGQIHKAETLRQSILKKAFSGQLVEQDPSDEPASVLLERIRAEKVQQVPRKKATKRKAATG